MVWPGVGTKVVEEVVEVAVVLVGLVVVGVADADVEEGLANVEVAVPDVELEVELADVEFEVPDIELEVADVKEEAVPDVKVDETVPDVELEVEFADVKLEEAVPDVEAEVVRLPIVEVLIVEVPKLELIVEVPMLELIVEVPMLELLLEELAATSYMLRWFPPPQYSVALPLQIMEHPVTPGVVPPTRFEPALMVFPQ